MKAIHQRMIDYRIACYEAGYPAGEARYDSIEEWERQHPGLDWYNINGFNREEGCGCG